MCAFVVHCGSMADNKVEHNLPQITEKMMHFQIMVVTMRVERNLVSGSA